LLLIKKTILLFGISLTCLTLYSDIDDYFPYEVNPTSSNYGITGILEMPNARMMGEGSLKFTFSSSFPNEFTTITATPFSWLEASYRYTEIKNKKYSKSSTFSGNQSWKDKGFDIKFKLLKEGYVLPAVAIGLRDVAGTGTFASEYVVFSKSFGNFDVTTGIGWGVLGRSGHMHINPFPSLFGKDYKTRISSNTGQGGTFNLNAWFSGQAAIFGGLEYDLKKYGLRFKLEYDTSDYDQDNINPLDVESHINFGLNYYLSDSFNIGLAFEKGNEFRLSFVLKGDFSKDTVSKPSPKYVQKPNSKQLIRLRQNKDLFYRSLNKSLRDENIYIQAASYNEEVVSLAVASSRFATTSRLAGRAARIASSLADEDVEEVIIHTMNGDFETATLAFNRKELDKANNFHSSPNEVYKKSLLYSNSDSTLLKNGDFLPKIKFPEITWNMSPGLKHQIGGPEAFYLGQLWWKTDINIKLKRNLTLYSSFGINIYNNFNQLNNPSYSDSAHVRSDIQEYLKEGENNIQRMQIEWMHSPLSDIFLRFDLGLLEEMFGGVGGEILYRPFNKKYAIGFSAHKVRQRGYKQRFSFREYKTNTGHFSFYYDLPKNLSVQILTGKYLAGDIGATVDISKRFKTGFTLGVFATKTNMSKVEFGEGAFDKGFYFSIPTKLFYTDYKSGNISFGLHPLTKDGGALLNQHNSLFSILGDSNKTSILRDWESLLD